MEVTIRGNNKAQVEKAMDELAKLDWLQDGADIGTTIVGGTSYHTATFHAKTKLDPKP